MKALILKNIPAEGPGTIGTFLEEGGAELRLVELGSGEEPPPADDFDALVVMGGPMAVYEMNDKHPFLGKAVKAIESMLGRGRPVLGVCLGAQLIAHTLGSRVYRGAGQEVGWYDVRLTEEGALDEAMRELEIEAESRRARVFQWHGDTYDLPAGAQRLASSDLFPEQAFRYGDNVYALQFHIEVTPELLSDWFSDEPGTGKAVVDELEKIRKDYDQRARGFYQAVFGL